MLALHVSNLVTHGWSRALIFNGLLALLLVDDITITGLARWLSRLGDRFAQRNLGIGDTLINSSGWLASNVDVIDSFSDIVFWPIRATVDIVKAGEWQPVLWLAVAILLVYSVILFMLAIKLFTAKDLHLTE